MAFGMDFFRKYQSRLLVILVALLMISWLVGYAVSQLLAPQPVRGAMFGEKVTDAQFRIARQVLWVVSAGGRPEDEDVWRFLVLLHEADRLGVRVTGEEVTAVLREWVRRLTGATDENIDLRYDTLLDRLRMTDDMVRFAWERNLRAVKIREMVVGALQPSEAEQWQRFVEVNLRLGVRKLEVPAEKFTAEVAEPAEDEIARYFERNEAKYQIPPLATVEYAAVLEEDIPSLLTVSDQAIAEYYEENKVEEFLLPLDQQDLSEGTDGDAEGAAEGESGAEGDAEGETEEPPQAQPAVPVDTGDAVTGRADPAVEEIIENPEEPFVQPREPEEPSPTEAAAGETLESSQDAPAAAAVEGASPETEDSSEPLYRPLSEVKEEIRKKLVDREVNALLSDVQADYLKQEEKNLQELAQNYGLKYFKVGPLSLDEPDKLGLLASAKTQRETPIIQEIFFNVASAEEFDPGSYGLRDAEGSDGHFLFTLVSMEAARKPALGEVRDRVQKEYVNERAGELAMEKAAQILEDLRENGWQSYLADKEYMNMIKEMTFSGDWPSPALVTAGAAVEEGDFGGPTFSENAAHVFQVRNRIEPTVEQFEKDRETQELLTPLVAMYGEAFVMKYLASQDEKRAVTEIAHFEQQKQAFLRKWEEDLRRRADIRESADREGTDGGYPGDDQEEM